MSPVRWPAALAALLLASLLAQTAPAGAQAPQQYKWVIMVYMDGDNNLESNAINDFNEMEAAGSTGDVAIVVLLDRAEGYDTSNGDWTGARIYLVEHDTDMKLIKSKLLKDLGEVDMGDPQTLVDFARFVVERFPAEHYALIIWDHGYAWRAGGAPPGRWVAWDEESQDYLTTAELYQALSQVNALTGGLDLLGFDACLMGMIEIAYDVAAGGYAKVMVASQDYEPAEGWYYTPFLLELAANPDMTAAELASRIVEAYRYYYTRVLVSTYATLTAVDLDALAAAASKLYYATLTMTYALWANQSLSQQALQALGGVEKTGDGVFPDAYSLLEALRDGVDWPQAYDPRGMIDSFLEDYNESIIAFWAAHGHSGLHGLSIYMPGDVDSYLRERHVYLRQTRFARSVGWAAFLDTVFYQSQPPGALEVRVEAPQLLALNETEYALVLVSYAGTPVDPDYLDVYVFYPGSNATTLNATWLAPGLYLVPLNLTEPGTAFIAAWASYWRLTARGAAAVKAGGLESMMPMLDERLREIGEALSNLTARVEYLGRGVFRLQLGQASINATLAGVRGDLALLNTSLGLVRVSLDALARSIAGNATALRDLVESTGGRIEGLLRALNASIVALHGDVATVATRLGEVNLTLQELGANLVVLDNRTVVIETMLGNITGVLDEVRDGIAYINTSLGRVKADVAIVNARVADSSETIQATLASLRKQATITMALAGVAAGLSGAALAYAVISTRRKRGGGERRISYF